jgi:hypothetical protein
MARKEEEKVVEIVKEKECLRAFNAIVFKTRQRKKSMVEAEEKNETRTSFIFGVLWTQKSKIEAKNPSMAKRGLFIFSDIHSTEVYFRVCNVIFDVRFEG